METNVKFSKALAEHFIIADGYTLNHLLLK